MLEVQAPSHISRKSGYSKALKVRFSNGFWLRERLIPFDQVD
jgi:hypothetical protein